MKRLFKDVIPLLPEMVLSAVVCALAGMLIYWFRGVHHAPYVSAIIGFFFPLLRHGASRKSVHRSL